MRGKRNLPQCIIAMTHPSSPHRLTRAIAREAFELLEAGRTVRQLLGAGGEPRRCFANVLRCVERDGGAMALGWLVKSNSGAAVRNRNVYARLNLEAHAVWCRPDGQLVEVTDENAGLPFLPHDAVRCPTNASLTFVDTLELAQQWHVPGVDHLIVPVPALPPEPTIVYGLGPLAPAPRP